MTKLVIPPQFKGMNWKKVFAHGIQQLEQGRYREGTETIDVSIRMFNNRQLSLFADK